MSAGAHETHVHFIGIGGSGLSAIARMMKESGYHVTGSDRVLSPFAEDLRGAGVTVHVGHAAGNIAGADWIVRSSAVPDDNAEVQAARAAGIPVYRRADILGKFMENKIGIAIAGTHGKTTTTAMIAHALSSMDLHPSFIVGGVLNDLGVNAGAGSGDFFVVEADEYDRMFLGLRPRLEVVTSIEHDHPDCYPTYDDMFAAFEAFARLLPTEGSLVASADDSGAASLMRKAAREQRGVLAYSTRGGADLAADRWMRAEGVISNERGGFDFQATTNVGGESAAAVRLQVPGRHNVSNALAALGVMALLGLSINQAAAAMSKFTGTGRRFEIQGEKKGIVVIDDYAHHPTEIKATLAAARSRFPGRRIWAVWQPHTYSRTRALFDGFVGAFGEADETIVTEIYAAREPEQDFSSEQIVKAISRETVHFVRSLEETSSYLLDHLKSGDVLIVLSAGDADRVGRDVLAGLEE
jgi:UDP-N-acetylmuramate--alanine ligase